MRILFWLVIGFLVYAWFKQMMRPRMRGKDKAAPGAAAPGAAAQVESMVRCGHCGLHLPASESIKDDAGTAYCSEQHRREHAP